jgi:ubiquinone/menaquinone biosynthesis C-methylase UbiE
MPKRLKETAQFVRDAIPVLREHRVKRILDLGSGAGRHCILLASNDFEVVGIDVSKNALRMAKRWARKEELENTELICANMTHIPLTGLCVDAVISVSVMHHAFKRDIITGVREVHRVLEGEGWFIANLASVCDPRCGTGRKLEKNTFWILERYEKRRFEELHHFFSKRELLKLLGLFSSVEVTPLKDRPNYWKISAIK